MGLEKEKTLKILDFDMETRLVGFHRAGQWQPAGCEPTAIACSWFGEKKIHVWLQKEMPVPEMIESFRVFLDQADIITGHNVRRFDLPILNFMCLEFGLPMLSSKLTQDTLRELPKMSGASKSQENLGAMLGLTEGKYHMNDINWRASTRLEEEGVERTRRRVMDDVKQHKQLYESLRDRGALKPPKLWRP